MIGNKLRPLIHQKIALCIVCFITYVVECTSVGSASSREVTFETSPDEQALKYSVFSGDCSESKPSTPVASMAMGAMMRATFLMITESFSTDCVILSDPLGLWATDGGVCGEKMALTCITSTDNLW